MSLQNAAVAATVTYGSRAGLCIETARRALAAGADQVVIVDNGSWPAAATELSLYAATESRVQLHRLEQNTGSALGFATAARLAAALTSGCVLFLDDDNWIDHAALTEARAALSAQGTNCVVSCFRVSDNLHRTVATGVTPGLAYPPKSSFMYFDALSRLRRVVARRRPVSGPTRIPYAPYGGLLVPKEVLRRVGPPDPSLVLYEDDTEWTNRMTRAGFPIYLVLSARVHDADGKWSTSRNQAAVLSPSGPARFLTSDSPDRLYFALRNRTIFDHTNRESGATGSVRYWLNRMLYFAILTAYVRPGRRMRNYQIMKQAIRDGDLRAHCRQRDARLSVHTKGWL